MRRLITSVITMLTVTAWCVAQPELDPSSWKVGQDISAELEWGDYDGTTNSGNYWKGSGASYSNDEWENFQTSNIDRYQFVWLPAGVYKLHAQAFHRYGDQGAAAKLYFTGTEPANHAYLYADILSGVQLSEEDAISIVDFTVDRTWQTALRSNWSEEVTYRIYEADDWQTDSHYAYTDPEGVTTDYYAPNSMAGSRAAFDMNLFWNEVTIVVKEDGYVKLGIRRDGENISSEWVLYSNFYITYEGDAGEAVERELAMEEYYAATYQAEQLAEQIEKDYPALAIMLQDAIMDLEFDESTIEGINEGTKLAKAMVNEYRIYLSQAKALTTLIGTCQALLETTDYSGKDALQAAIDAAVKVEKAGTSEGNETIEAPSDYADANKVLNDAKVAYIIAGGGDQRYTDFSGTIYQPFFTDAAYIPTWDEEEGVYKFQPEIEDTWMTIQEKSYDEAKAEHSDWIPICDGFSITDNRNAEGQWIIESRTWHGGGAIGVTMQHGYPAIGGWNAEPTGNPELLYQVITGLPDGFYSMSALMCNAGADLSPLQYVFIENTAGDREISLLTQKGNPWWGGERDQWRQTVWEKLTTGMVQVTDGRVKIGTASDAFYATTGFQLYYWGEKPDFSAMIQEKIVDVQNDMAEKLNFPGDLAAVQAILDKVEMPVTGFEAYTDALARIDEANEYMNAAYNYLNNYALMEQIMNDEVDYPDGDAAIQILDNYAFEYVMLIGTHEDDTYKTAQEATATYAALKAYLTDRNSKLASPDAGQEVKDIVAQHNVTLMTEPLTIPLIESLQRELAIAFNQGLIARLGLDKATPLTPVDVTSFLNNPSFDDGTNGWNGDLTVDRELQNAERYNTTFDFNQTLYSLPRGRYTLRVQAFYRDGGVGNTEGGAYFNWWYAAAADAELWENHNVELYAKTNTDEQTSYVTSICSEQIEERSLLRIFRGIDEESGEPLIIDGQQQYDANGNEIWINQDTIWYRYDDEEPNWQFDIAVREEVTPGDTVTYYYPNSMRGTAARFANSPEAYWNEVTIGVEDGQNLTVGMRKSIGIDNDWCIFDNFRLLYLGTEGMPPVGIDHIQTANAARGTIFNISGQQLAAPQRGINIIDGKKVLVK